MERFWNKVNKNTDTGCWEWTARINRGGYGQFKLDGKFKTVSRLSYEWAFGIELTPNQFICHKCDNRKCVNPDHLFVGTHTDNMRDMWTKGRGKTSEQIGSKNNNSKLTDDDIIKIKQRIKNKETNISIANDFNVTHVMISLIRNNKRWKHISIDNNGPLA